MRNPIYGPKVSVFVAIAMFLAVSVWHWLWDVDVLDYGPRQATHFDVSEAHSGDQIHICFDKVTWRRVCKSRFVQNITCPMNDPNHPGKTAISRLDLEPHQIDVPPQSGPVPAKCRRFTVPNECLPGTLKFSAFAESSCPPFGDWNLRYTHPPEIELKILSGNVPR